MDVFSFPAEFVNPKDKELPEYGLQYAKAAYYSNNTFGGRLFRDDADFITLTELSQGRQSVEGLRRLSGFRPPLDPHVTDGPHSLAYIDPQIMNLAPKYINRAVAKMQRINYDIGLEAIDLNSVNEKADFAATVQAFYRLKKTVELMGIPAQAAFPDVDVASFPKYPDEMIYDINTNPKLKKEIAGELTLTLIMSMNNFRKKMRQVDWDLVVYGRGHLHIYNDVNLFPRIEWVNPKYWGGSWIENDDFEDQEYSFFLDCITVSQFIREAGQQYSQAELQYIVQKHAIRNSTFQPNIATRPINNTFDNLNYLPVMRFYFKSEDCRNFITKKNRFGSKTMMERSYNYQPSDVTLEDIQNKKTKLINNTYTSIYGGTWIIDSEIVYNYGQKKYPRSNMVDATLPIKTAATNWKAGRCVSYAAQLSEPLFMINFAWQKIKEIGAKEYVGIMEMDFNQIENVALGRGGRQWDAREVVEFMEMTKRLVKRSNTNQYGQSNGSALSFHNTGVVLADYFNMLNIGIMMLENQGGTTLAESTNKPNRLAVGVMEASQFTGDLDMEFLYDARDYIYQRSAHTMLLLAQEAKRNKTKLAGRIPALGNVNSGYYDVPDDIAYCDYGLMITRQASDEEKMNFYQNDLLIALKEGRISAADSAFVREIDNLKQARQVLANREIAYQRQVQEQKMMDIKANMQANAQAAQMKEEGERRLIQDKKDADAELAILKGRIDQMLQQQKGEMDAMIANISSEMKQNIEKQKNITELMKQGVRNQPEFQKVDAIKERNKLQMNKPVKKSA